MPAKEKVRIYHNPRCGTSRTVLGMLTESGAEPEVVEYLKTGWSREILNEILTRSGLTPKDILRKKEPLAKELGLEKAADKAILDAMIANPILVERPIVVAPRGTVVCRPAERVWEVVSRG
ncbi:MAG: arsenate reductase (glutaredoxin) [Caulobacteraceae bacterium]|nr:arsenate reductase (glutaredoxin) [Caulobacteraceae bacterium]